MTDADREVLKSHISVTSAAFQVLTTCLIENGILRKNQFPAALLTHMEVVKHRDGNEIELALLNDIRSALIDPV